MDKAGKPVCPRCYRALATVAGKGRSVRNTPRVPQHDKPLSRDQQRVQQRDQQKGRRQS
ncbi:MAG TPA: hypothetical protein VF477_13205 [Mycobacterium sp.]